VGDKSNIPQELLKNLSKTIKNLLYRVREKWNKCGRTQQYFKKENEDWLNQTLSFDTEIETFLAHNISTDTGQKWL
jgi:hypothetical protein